MKANKKIQPANPNGSLRRVKKISQILKIMLLGYLFVLPLYVIAISGKNGQPTWNVASQTYSSFSDIPAMQKLLMALISVSYLLIAATFYRLLNLYEKGIFFSSQNARLFRIIGCSAFGVGLIGVVTPVITSGLLIFPSLLFSIIGSPWIVGGLFGIMVSFIMDEGCRMRDEQDLTV